MMAFITKPDDMVGRRVAKVFGAKASVESVVILFDDRTAAVICGCCDGDGAMIEDDPIELAWAAAKIAAWCKP